MDKEQIINLKKFIKEENSGGQRLNSLRLPRDLTLGGLAKPKKQFVPNLNITRNKEKAKEVLKKNGVAPKIKDEKVNKKEPNTIKKKDAGRFVQSSGIFSDGIGADIRKTGKWSDKRSDKENDGGGPSSMSIPSLKKKTWVIDKKAESNVLDDLMCQDDNEDVDEKLPFQPINWITVTSEVKKDIKTEPSQQSSSKMVSIQPALSKLKLEYSHCISNEYLDGIYDDNNPATSVWKMPDSLCGKGLSDDPKCKEIFDYCLDNMLEGQIGKVVIRQSGKMEVHIGQGIYQLEQPQLDCYSEDIVVLDPNSEKGLAATVLAGIKNRFSLNPDWDMLLK